MAITERIGLLCSSVVKLKDNVKLRFGDGASAGDKALSDIDITWNGTKLLVAQSTTNSAIDLGVSGAGIDLQLYGDTAGADALWDQSADSFILGDSAKLVLGTGSDMSLAWDGTDADLLAAADDSVFKVGNGTNSFDVWIYGNTASDYVLWDASAGKLSLEGAAYQQLDSFRRTVTAKTADYTVVAADSGTVFTTTGAAGAVNFTLPAVAAGYEFTFVNTVDQNMAITAPAGTLVALNNAGLTSATFSTASEKIGAAATVICDGTKYLFLNHSDEAQTVTLA